MFEREPRRERRTMFPTTTVNSGPTHNGPDVPQVELESLRGISFFVPKGCKGKEIIGIVKSKSTINGNGFVPLKGSVIIPQEKKPITRVFRTSHGGGRVGGGGTSEEAIRRAKRKARKQNKK